MEPLAGLPAGIASRLVPGINGLTVHMLEAGEAGRPCVLLLHGFPELAYSWRKVMLPLAAAGYHVVAPDLRGYGRTTGGDTRYDGDLASYRMTNVVRDVIGLAWALGHRRVAGVFGHDYGSPVAAWCALLRPDVFRSVALMSAPFAGAPDLPFDTVAHPPPPAPDVQAELAALPRPRKHYQWYYSTREAAPDMDHAPQGVHDFLRAYYHVKSADWPENAPRPLAGWTAAELARMPTYYVMDRDRTMPETVAPAMPSAAQVAANRWLPEAELAVYAAEYRRTGFQGALQFYRFRTTPGIAADLQLFAGRTIDVPALYVAGRSDWGVYQTPGALERMRSAACTDLRGVHLVDGAGHWVQQEQPERAAALLTGFLAETARA